MYIQKQLRYKNRELPKTQFPITKFFARGKRMPEKEFIEFFKKIEERESQLDGECTKLVVEGLMSETFLKRSGLLRQAGDKKTRFVIEYDARTGKGWHRIVTEP